MDKTHAILIRRIRFSETSLICIWLTREHAKIRTSARGALRPGSPFAGKLDFLYETEIGFSRSRQGDLHPLREVVLHQPFDGHGTDYANLMVGAYFASLVDRLTEPEGHAAEIFDLLQRALVYLRKERAEPRSIAHFETELCQALGIRDSHVRADPLHALAGHCGTLPQNARQRALHATSCPPAGAG